MLSNLNCVEVPLQEKTNIDKGKRFLEIGSLVTLTLSPNDIKETFLS